MSSGKILVIDDNPVIVRMNESLLKTNGYEVISVGNGVDGLKKAEEEQPDVILLDIILPEMHGFDVCRRLKGSDKTKHIPVIIVTASGLEDIAREEPDVCADAYIKKPYNLQNLLDTIRQAKENIRKLDAEGQDA